MIYTHWRLLKNINQHSFGFMDHSKKKNSFCILKKLPTLLHISIKRAQNEVLHYQKIIKN